MKGLDPVRPQVASDEIYPVLLVWGHIAMIIRAEMHFLKSESA
jgi:hypothetical protein